MTYVAAFGFVFIGICFGALLEHLLSGFSRSDLEQECFQMEMELARFKRGGR